MIPALLALTAAALFTGAAVYITLAEQPARLLLPDAALLCSGAAPMPAACRCRRGSP